MKFKKTFVVGICISFIMASLAGCATGNPPALASEVKVPVTETTGQETITNPLDHEQFSARDKETGYDETTSLVITLKDEGSQANSNAVQVNGNTVRITDEGTYILRGDLSEGQIIIDAEKTDKLQLVLDGVTINSQSSAPLYIKQAAKVFITLAKDSENSLSTSGEFIQIDDHKINGVIYSRDDLTLNGEGSLVVSTQYGRGIVSKDDLVFTGGHYEITTTDHGIVGNTIRVLEGVYHITASEDALNSKSEIFIVGGNFEISAGDDGIHADLNVTIQGGVINIIESYEGIEGESVEITGGTIHLVASDDGINASSSVESTTANPQQGKGGFAIDDNTYIKISGGLIHVNAQGDGIDANGNVFVTGGEVYVSASTNNGDAALDYDGRAEVSGGIFVATGSSGMAQNFGTNSTQGSILVNTSTVQSGPLILKDHAGEELLNFTPDKPYSSAVISLPEILENESYTVIMGNESQTIQMDSIIYGSSGGMGGGRPGGMGGGRPGGMGGQGQGNPPTGERPEGVNGQIPKGERPKGEMPNGRPENPKGEIQNGL